MALKKNKKTDGLGAYEISKIRSAIRLVWQRSLSRSLVTKRCSVGNDFYKCEQCQSIVPKIAIDHIVQVGDLNDGFIPRLFCPSSGLQGLCKKCHGEKTKTERAQKKGKK